MALVGVVRDMLEQYKRHIFGSILIQSFYGLGILICMPAYAQYSLQEAIETSQQNDPWLRGSEFRQESIAAKSIVAGQLPDPVISVNLANLPVDGFDFSQEAMTQFQIGISQDFPRGNSRMLQRQQLQEMSLKQPLMRADRKAKVAVLVTHLWLDSYRYRESIRLVHESENLFKNLIDIVQSRYSSALGNTSQHDLIRAQLELSQFEERLIQLQQKQDSVQMLLSEWLPIQNLDNQAFAQSLPDQLPRLSLISLNTSKASSAYIDELTRRLNQHPAIASIDQQIRAGGSAVQLAQQSYKPQLGINAMYGYRDEDPIGNSRADFFSVGLTLDVPLFTTQRQDKQVQSAVADVEELKTQKALLLRRMRAQYESEQARLVLLQKRQKLYKNQLLIETHAQTEASLTAYTNDDGDFSEVVRARIVELNAQIDALNIDIDQLKTIASLNYFFASSDTLQNGKANHVK